MVLETSRLLREGFLAAERDGSRWMPIRRSRSRSACWSSVLHFHDRGMNIIKRGAPISLIHDLPVVDTLIRMKIQYPNEELENSTTFKRQLTSR
jgi:hypothetical protein